MPVTLITKVIIRVLIAAAIIVLSMAFNMMLNVLLIPSSYILNLFFALKVVGVIILLIQGEFRWTTSFRIALTGLLPVLVYQVVVLLEFIYYAGSPIFLIEYGIHFNVLGYSIILGAYLVYLYTNKKWTLLSRLKLYFIIIQFFIGVLEHYLFLNWINMLQFNLVQLVSIFLMLVILTASYRYRRLSIM